MNAMMNKRTVIKSFGGVAAAALLAPVAWAQKFPAKPVTLMVPYTPGGVSDVVARLLTNTMGEKLGQPVIVENLAGASGGIAIQRVLSMPSDGHYVFVGSPNEVILAPLANATLKFKNEDFRMIKKIADLTMVVETRTEFPAANADELVAYAAKRAKEGNPLTYGSVGAGSLYHLLGEKLSQVTGIPMIHVPYKGGTAMVPDLISGRIDFSITPVGSSTMSMVESKKSKLVTTLTKERVPAFKNVPAVQESKALKDFIYSVWLGLFVKKDTPEPVVQALQSAATAALSNNSEVTPKFEALAITPAGNLTLAETDQVFRNSTEQFRAIAKSIDLKPQ